MYSWGRKAFCFKYSIFIYDHNVNSCQLRSDDYHSATIFYYFKVCLHNVASISINLSYWLIVGCLTSSGKYFMHIQDENKFTKNTIGRLIRQMPPGMMVWEICHWKMRISWIGTEILPCNKPPTDHSKELLQGFLTCKECGTLFTRGIGFNAPLLTGRDCELDTSRTAKRTPHFGKRFTAGREKTKSPYFYTPVTLGVLVV